MEIHIEATPKQLANGLTAWVVDVRVPIEGPISGKNVIQAKATSTLPGKAGKVDALNKAVSIVDQVASNPVLQALMPPGTAAAVTLTKELARGISSGSVQHVIDKYGGIAQGTYQQVQRFLHVFG